MIHIPVNFIDRAEAREKQHYQDPVFSREAILDLIAFNGKKVLISDFFCLYPQDSEQQKALEYRLRAMVRDGQLVVIDNSYTTLEYWPLVEGSVVSHEKQIMAALSEPDGFFPIMKTPPCAIFPGDYAVFAFIEPLQKVVFHSLKSATHVYIHGVLENAKEYDLPSGYPIAVRVEEGPFAEQVISARNLSKKDYSIGSRVVVCLDRQGDGDYLVGDIVEFVGAPKGIHDIISEYNLPWLWPLEVQKEADHYSDHVIEFTSDREDLSEKPFVTIDGITAKDFDDAVYAERREDQGWELYVAIADVAHYVKIGSAIDKEASSRGVSVYFPRYVIPMLPEILSNELCSLKPNELRYSLVCQIHYNSAGAREGFRFYKAIIRSHARLTYDQVQRRDIPVVLKKNVSDLWEIYGLLKQNRQDRGYISFSQQGIHFDVTDNEKVLGVSRVPPLESHSLIEEMMLAANECAALYIQEHSSIGVYRVHDEPLEAKVQLLNATLKNIGYELQPPYTLEKISQLSQYLQEHYPKFSVLISRIMQRAGYQIAPDRHFGLNFDLYTHFTSPIRRYPDLIVHRLIYSILSQKKSVDFQGKVKSSLDRVNYLERRAEEAERAYQQMLKVKFAQTLQGKSFSAYITGLSEFGVFIELDEYPLDGMVHVSQLGEGFWIYKPESSLISNGKSEWKIGDTLMVKLHQCDVTTQRIHFIAVERL